MTRNTAEPRKIVFYSISTHLGGAEKSLLDILRNLGPVSEGRFLPHAVFPSTKGPLLDILDREKRPYSVVEMPEAFLRLSRNNLAGLPRDLVRSAPGMVAYAGRLSRTMAGLSPAFIHTTGIKCHLLSALLIDGAPVVWHFRDLLATRTLRLAFRALYAKNRIRVIANSHATARSLPFASTVLHNGIDLSAFSGAYAGRLHRLLNLDADTQLIGILGVLARWKGQKEFLLIAKRMIDSGHPAHFAVIGDEIYDTTGEAGYKNELLQLAKNLNIRERVHFTGFIENPETVLPGLNVLVHCSLKPEPFGRVLVEAMASGVPVVAADDGGVREIIADGESGWLCRPGDIDGYCRAVAEAAGTDEKRSRIVRTARTAAAEKFSLDRQMLKLVSLYDEFA